MADDVWVNVASASHVEDGTMQPLQIEDKDLALYRVEGEFYVTDNTCTHAFALLTDGYLDGCEIECPLHAGRFDIKTGKGQGAPIFTDIRSYPTRVVDGQVQINLAE